MEEHTLRAARNDADYALVVAAQPDASADQLRALVAKLAGTVYDVAEVADRRGEQLKAPAAIALRDALRTALGN